LYRGLTKLTLLEMVVTYITGSPGNGLGNFSHKRD